MDEYIEREAAYNAIVNNYMVDDQLQDLCSIPSADVQPVVMGQWIKIKYRSICRDCSFRGFASWNFCPNCGADMREPPKEET